MSWKLSPVVDDKILVSANRTRTPSCNLQDSFWIWADAGLPRLQWFPAALYVMKTVNICVLMKFIIHGVLQSYLEVSTILFPDRVTAICGFERNTFHVLHRYFWRNDSRPVLRIKISLDKICFRVKLVLILFFFNFSFIISGCLIIVVVEINRSTTQVSGHHERF